MIKEYIIYTKISVLFRFLDKQVKAKQTKNVINLFMENIQCHMSDSHFTGFYLLIELLLTCATDTMSEQQVGSAPASAAASATSVAEEQRSGSVGGEKGIPSACCLYIARTVD